MLKIGLCGFTIGQREYFETFPVLEVQQTFYDPPDRRVLLRWREAAPEGFEFTMKAWQMITHRSSSKTYRRLKRKLDPKEKADVGAFQLNDTTLEAWDVTRECARILRATAILFQCPPSFRPEEENVANMRRFFPAIERPEGVRFLWEPRGEAWSDDLVRDLCAELGLIHVVDPFERDSVTPELTYWRLHGIRTHYHVYTDEELQALAARIPKDGDTYAMFNNVPRVGDAQRFANIVRSLPCGPAEM